MLHISFLIILLSYILCYEQCVDDYCPPDPVKTRLLTLGEHDEPAITIGRDEESGCYCKEYPKLYVRCFGRQHCSKIPVQTSVKTPIFFLVNTRITLIKKGELDRFNHLDMMKIESNYNLEKIEEGCFWKLGNLTALSITSNANLNVLEKETFLGLNSLKELYLSENGFNKIIDVTVALSIKNLPNLVTLYLDKNNFQVIEKDDFSSMVNSKLKEINLTLCRIEYMHPEGLTTFKNLIFLKLGLNSFNSTTIARVLNKTIEANVPLKSLSLYGAGFRKKPPKRLMETIGKSNITYLTLAKNRFEILSNESFPYMPNLQSLDLAEVLALNITNNAFTNIPNLKTLVLSGNKLTNIPNGVLLENLTYLDMQLNSGSLFFPSYLSVYKSRFKLMKKLNYLNLSYNRLDALYKDTFTGLDNLKLLGMKNSSVYFIENGSFASLSNLQFLDLENNGFIKYDAVGIQEDIFKGLVNLQVLILAGCNIPYISLHSNPFKHLPKLVHLDLQRNEIAVLSFNDFNSLPKLETLDLSSNLLNSWNERIFYNNSKLTDVNLSKNKFTYLSETVLEDFRNLTKLELSDNPFICDCSNYYVVENWVLRTNSSILETISNQKSFCEFPDIYNNITIDEYIHGVRNGSLFCEVETSSSRLIIIVPLLIFAVILVCIIFFLIYYRHRVRYWLFLTRLYLSRKGKINKKRKKRSVKIYTNYSFDAFVSYSCEDRNFVVQMVSMLEDYEPFLKLCVYERDFQIGTFISESVLECVAKSRKTILIISDNYVKSQWCRWESHIAHHHKLFFENEDGEFVDDNIIMIKIGPVSNSHLTPTLKYLLKTRIYLQWDSDEKKQKVFWEKLRSTLVPPKNYFEENTSM